MNIKEVFYVPFFKIPQRARVIFKIQQTEQSSASSLVDKSTFRIRFHHYQEFKTHFHFHFSRSLPREEEKEDRIGSDLFCSVSGILLPFSPFKWFFSSLSLSPRCSDDLGFGHGFEEDLERAQGSPEGPSNIMQRRYLSSTPHFFFVNAITYWF